jgi:dUTPase
MLRVQKLSAAAALPERASPGAAGYDLRSAQYVAVPARGKV